MSNVNNTATKTAKKGKLYSKETLKLLKEFKSKDWIFNMLNEPSSSKDGVDVKLILTVMEKGAAMTEKGRPTLHNIQAIGSGKTLHEAQDEALRRALTLVL